MVCKYCGVSNSEGAVYCKGCGKRLDGSASCPSCGKLIDGDSVFCSYCGQPVVKSATGAITERKAVSGVAEQKEQVPAPVAPERYAERAVNVKKVLNYTALAAALAMAVFSLIFVFLIGFTSVYTVAGEKTLFSSIDLYYYFGKAYKVIDEFNTVEADLNEFFFITSYIPAVFGTIVAAITLIMVSVFSIIAIVCCARRLAGKSGYNGVSCAFPAFASFVTGSLLLLALNNANVEIGSGVFAVKTSYRLNDASIAGIVLCSLFAAVYLGCSVAARGKELAETEALIKTIFSIVAIVIIAVIMVLLSLPAFGIDSEELGTWDSINVGVMYLLSVLGGLCSTNANLNKVTNSGTVLAYGVISFIALIALAVFCAVLFTKTVENSAKQNSKTSNLALNCIMVVFAVIFLVFSILTGNEFVKAIEFAESVSIWGESLESDFGMTVAVPIAVLVLSVISLGVSITRRCLSEKFEKK